MTKIVVDDISAKIVVESIKKYIPISKNYGRKYKEIYTNQVKQVLVDIFSVFSIRIEGRGISTIFRLSIVYVFCWVL